MRRAIAVLVFSVFATPSFAQEVFWAPGTTTSQLGGIVIVRQGNQTTMSLGGILFPRAVKVKTRTPDGPVITRFKLPAALCSPQNLSPLEVTPALIQVDIPDPNGILYIDGELVRTFGQSRQLESPGLTPGRAIPVKIRGAFVIGDQLLIEDRTLVLRAGETTHVTFEGKNAVAVPFRRTPDVNLATGQALP